MYNRLILIACGVLTWAGTIANLWTWHSAVVGTICWLGLLTVAAWSSGKWLASTRTAGLLVGSLVTISTIITVGAITYYLSQLDRTTITFLTLIPLVITIGANLWPRPLPAQPPTTWHWSPAIIWRGFHLSFLTSLALALDLVIVYVLIKFQTSNAIQTPWDAVAAGRFFILYLGATITTLAILSLQPRRVVAAPIMMAHAFVTVGVATVVYRLGFGFDPFIHQATEQFIAAHGAITPKPLYYLGQYSLVVMWHQLTLWPIAVIDRFLVPVLTAIILPLLFLLTPMRPVTTKMSPLAWAAIWLIPFGAWIITTPQSLANLFTVITIFGIVGYRQRHSSAMVPIMTTLAAIAIHPLAGVPAAIASALAILVPRNGNGKWIATLRIILAAIVSLVSTVALPVAFWFNNRWSTADVDYHWEKIINPGAWWELILSWLPIYANRYAGWVDVVYFYQSWWPILGLALTAIGVIAWWRSHWRRTATVLVVSAGIITLNAVVLQLVAQFDFVIDYERSNYVARLYDMAWLFLIPMMIAGLDVIIRRLWAWPATVRAMTLLILAAAIAMCTYLSYPHNDAYETGRFYSVSSTDIKAAQLIHRDANGADYIVLANQQTSAAALQQFGFAKYYPGDIFYYPIPTSQPLYQHYLDFVYAQPSRQIMRNAMDTASVNLGYFVINSYWDNFDRIVEDAKQEANWFNVIDNGKAYVFKFTR